MQARDYLNILVQDIHSTTIATLAEDGFAQTRVIDMMLSDERGVYFLTAKGKAFYAQLMEQRFVALSATKLWRRSDAMLPRVLAIFEAVLPRVS